MISNLQAVRQALTKHQPIDVQVFGIDCKHNPSAVIEAMTTRDIRPHRSVQSPKRKIETLNRVDYRFNYSFHGVFARFGRTFENPLTI